jgi:F-type H+-transporting ATPase subunit a
MTERLLAEGAIEVGHHETQNWFGLTVNVDTVASAALAAVIVIALAFFLRAKVTSSGVPGACSCSSRRSPSRCATRSNPRSG